MSDFFSHQQPVHANGTLHKLFFQERKCTKTDGLFHVHNQVHRRHCRIEIPSENLTNPSFDFVSDHRFPYFSGYRNAEAVKLFLIERSVKYKMRALYLRSAFVGVLELLGLAKSLFPVKSFLKLIHSPSTDAGPLLCAFSALLVPAWYSYGRGNHGSSGGADCWVETFFS